MFFDSCVLPWTCIWLAISGQALHELLLAERDSKVTSLEEDVALAASPAAAQLGARTALALAFRIEKKRLLAAAIAATQPAAAVMA